MNGWQTLLYKEVLRFWKVGFQTVGAPILTAVLYMLIFGHVLQDQVKVYGSVSYTAFLVPGLVMMSVLQNAFANSSSSLIQSKIMGNLVFLLLTPLSHWHWFVAYVGSSVLRGLAVGAGVFVVTVYFGQPSFVAPLWIVVFAVLGAALLGAKQAPSAFLTELIGDESIQPMLRHAEVTPGAAAPRSQACPRCGKGYLLLRKGEYGEFMGCSTFPRCRYKNSVKKLVGR